LNPGIYVTASGFLAQQKQLEIIANNLANANTVGYKGDMAVYRTYHSSHADSRRGGVRPLWNPGFVALTGQAIDLSQGPLRRTGNPLDIAIAGDGFFEIQTPRGERYTRKGDFALAGDGTLVTQGGHAVMGAEGAIVLTEGEIEIDGEGSVFVDGRQQGQLRVVTFSDTEKLVKEGDAQFAWTGKSSEARPLEEVEIRPGFLESSNVNPIREMVQMIDAIRSYEVQQKVIHAFDDTRKKVVEEVGRLR
jgi:flagellar basal-body rod protein FlgG